MTYKGDRKKFIQLRLSPELKERIRSAAQAERVTMTRYVEDAIGQKLRGAGEEPDQAPYSK